MMELILIAASLVTFYALLSNRLFAFARPLREEATDLAQAIHDDERFSAPRRARALRMAGRMTSTFVAWVLVIMFVGVLLEATVNWLIGSKHDNHEHDLDGVPSDCRHIWRVFVRATMFASLCTSPIALIIFGAMIGAASFVRSGGELADDVMIKANAPRGGDQDDLCPPAHPV